MCVPNFDALCNVQLPLHTESNIKFEIDKSFNML